MASDVKIVGYHTRRDGSKKVLCPGCMPYMSDEDHPIYSDDGDWKKLSCAACSEPLKVGGDAP